MMSISLMKDPGAQFNKYFCFLNFAPGEKDENGVRRFNFNNGLSFKLVPLKLAEMSQALIANAKGQGRILGKFSLMVDGSRSVTGTGGRKSMFLNYNPADEEKGTPPTIMLTAKADGGNSINVVMPAVSALAVADVCQKFFDEYFKRDIETFEPPVGKRREPEEADSYKPAAPSGSNYPRKTQASEDINFSSEAPF